MCVMYARWYLRLFSLCAPSTYLSLIRPTPKHARVHMYFSKYIHKKTSCNLCYKIVAIKSQNYLRLLMYLNVRLAVCVCGVWCWCVCTAGFKQKLKRLRTERANDFGVVAFCVHYDGFIVFVWFVARARGEVDERIAIHSRRLCGGALIMMDAMLEPHNYASQRERERERRADRIASHWLPEMQYSTPLCCSAAWARLDCTQICVRPSGVFANIWWFIKLVRAAIMQRYEHNHYDPLNIHSRGPGVCVYVCSPVSQLLDVGEAEMGGCVEHS